ncbi:RNA-binding RNA annealing protein [Clarireedia jacksonii]
MSDKLDSSLDEILATRKVGLARNARKDLRRKAPAGGVKKTQKPTKGAVKAGPITSTPEQLASKILIENLPGDVNEQMVKEYFKGAKLGTKSVEISYGPTGVSRGRATVAFHRPADATTAMKALDGVSIDKGPILKVNLVVDAKSIVSTLPSGAPKKLNDRISAPKSQPKSAAINNNKPGNARGKAQPKKKDGKRPGRPARPAKKTAEELDLEMADYWESGNGATGDNSNNQAGMDNGNQVANAAAQPATSGDANMDDEIL